MKKTSNYIVEERIFDQKELITKCATEFLNLSFMRGSEEKVDEEILKTLLLDNVFLIGKKASILKVVLNGSSKLLKEDLEIDFPCYSVANMNISNAEVVKDWNMCNINNIELS